MDEGLKFYIKLFVKDVEKHYTGIIIDTPLGQLLELDRLSSTLSTEEREAFKYAKISHVVCLANNGREYVFYNLAWLGTRTNYGETNIVMHFRLSFEVLIENPTKDNLYNDVNFSFDFIEDIFGRTTFNTQFPLEENNNEIKLSLIVPDDVSVKLDDGTTIIVMSDFDGLASSHHLYDIDIKQTKKIRVKFPSGKDLFEISRFIEVLKLYFEFVYNHRLGFNTVKLININIPKGYHQADLLIAELYNTTKLKTLIKFKSRYNGSNTDLVERSKKWIELYENFNESILLWKKTIYNDNVDKTDKFIWTCQAFESMCQKDDGIYSKALILAKFKNKRKSYPNLSDYLNVVEEIIDFKFPSRLKYYRNLVKVRDKLTHNNPNKTVTDTQKDESYRLMDFFYLSLISVKLDSIKISRMISLP